MATKSAHIDHVHVRSARTPLPAGRPRSWYIRHNRRRKAMRLAIALLDSGVYAPGYATDHKIRAAAEVAGVRQPSEATCELVRTLLRAHR
ncbi:hypothetical protein [Nocardia cyriacigeorgica]|uniref:hypothetical protein n=1 Tax=Nocardia cyriacigeorgica TaxID=135487 RepID=UPI0024564090|nr:hypothetical protein [Nocardia cyriacigeorgica]